MEVRANGATLNSPGRGPGHGHQKRARSPIGAAFHQYPTYPGNVTPMGLSLASAVNPGLRPGLFQVAPLARQATLSLIGVRD